MKITDYGVWFKDWRTDEFTMMPKYDGEDICLNGTIIGELYGCSSFSVHKRYLNEIRFKINPKSPGVKDGAWWTFPEGYIPTDSDFEELP